MSTLYAIVGEHHDDPHRYLVLGEDGAYYEWDLVTERTSPIEPGEEWAMDPQVPVDDLQFDDVFIEP
jgi:hypothetical protein